MTSSLHQHQGHTHIDPGGTLTRDLLTYAARPGRRCTAGGHRPRKAIGGAGGKAAGYVEREFAAALRTAPAGTVPARHRQSTRSEMANPGSPVAMPRVHGPTEANWGATFYVPHASRSLLYRLIVSRL